MYEADTIIPPKAILKQPSPSRMARDDFIQRFGSIYEHSPQIAAQCFDQGLSPSDDYALALAYKLAAIVTEGGEAVQSQIIKLHPDLAGKLALANGLTAASKAEQAGAGLDQCTTEELAQFQNYNQAYRQKFDFPFIIAVKGLNRPTILSQFALRLKNDKEQEFITAMSQVHRIAAFRLLADTESRES